MMGFGDCPYVLLENVSGLVVHMQNWARCFGLANFSAQPLSCCPFIFLTQVLASAAHIFS